MRSLCSFLTFLSSTLPCPSLSETQSRTLCEYFNFLLRFCFCLLLTDTSKTQALPSNCCHHLDLFFSPSGCSSSCVELTLILRENQAGGNIEVSRHIDAKFFCQFSLLQTPFCLCVQDPSHSAWSGRLNRLVQTFFSASFFLSERLNYGLPNECASLKCARTSTQGVQIVFIKSYHSTGSQVAQNPKLLQLSQQTQFDCKEVWGAPSFCC